MVGTNKKVSTLTNSNHMVDIVIDENPIRHVTEYDAVLIGTNCYQVMRNGFQAEVVKQYPYVKDCNYQTKYGDPDKLGTILECKEKDKPLFILMYVTFGYNFKGNNEDFFNYDAFGNCLRLINILYKGSDIATTMVGCTEFDGNADKQRILDIINKEVRDFNLTIYDYHQLSHGELNYLEYFQNLKKRYERNKAKTRYTGTN